MEGIPPTLETDVEDVAWALQTADALWKRNERGDALVWLRRAAQAAVEANDDDRALTLARGAAELAELMAQPATPEPSPSRANLGSLNPASARALTPKAPIEPPPPLPVEVASLVSREAAATEQPTIVPAPADASHPETVPDLHVAVSVEEPSRVASSVSSPLTSAAPQAAVPVTASSDSHVPTAAETHAGMLDPWAEAEAKRASERPPPRRRLSSSASDGAIGFEEDEVVTSVKTQHTARPRPAAPLTPPPPAPGAPSPPKAASGKPSAPKIAVPKPPVPKPPKPPPLPSTAAGANPRPASAPTQPVARATSPPPPVAAPPAPVSVEETTSASLPAPGPAAPAPPSGPPRPLSAPPAPAPSPRRPLSAPPALAASPGRPLSAPPAPVLQPPPAAPKKIVSVPVPNSEIAPAPPPATAVAAFEDAAAAVAQEAPAPPLDLSRVDAFNDLPDDVRNRFASAAKMKGLARGEMVEGFGLAFVSHGATDVRAAGAQAVSVSLATGAVLRGRGTLDVAVPIQLVCASERATVAVWTEAEVEEMFGPCPWVEEDLRAAADRVQALAGLSLGPLGESNYDPVRPILADRLILRALTAGEPLLREADPVHGLFAVACGEIELTGAEGADSSTQLRAGAFVFAAQTLAMGRAPQTARAGSAGALILHADRSTTQELLVTQPLLLELLSSA